MCPERGVVDRKDVILLLAYILRTTLDLSQQVYYTDI